MSVNHAKSSQTLLDAAATAVQALSEAITEADHPEVGESARVMAATISIAHAYATLALVEQQRIANLISLWQGSQTRWEYATEATGALFKERGSLRPEIAEALGVVAK